MSERHCSIRFTRRYREAAPEVWKALIEPASLARWLAPGFEVSRTEVEPGRVLELDWRPSGEAPSLVRFELLPDGDSTILVLEHTRIEEQLGMRYMARWSAALDSLPLRIQR